MPSRSGFAMALLLPLLAAHTARTIEPAEIAGRGRVHGATPEQAREAAQHPHSAWVTNEPEPTPPAPRQTRFSIGIACT